MSYFNVNAAFSNHLIVKSENVIVVHTDCSVSPLSADNAFYVQELHVFL